MKHIAIMIDEQMHKELKKLCIDRDTSVTQFFKEYAEKEIAKAKKEQTR